jgi:ABC-type polysaccharide/polyol phosphate export permease
MEEIRQRAANIVRFLSMAGVVGSLLFMYAYGADEHNIRPVAEDVLSGISKTTLFYYGLGVFAVFNVLMNWGIKVYREATGYDKSSRLFKNETHKARILFWLTLMLSAINLLITSAVTFIAFIKIEGVSAQTDYLPIPIIGLTILFVVLVGLLISVFRNK